MTQNVNTETELTFTLDELLAAMEAALPDGGDALTMEEWLDLLHEAGHLIGRTRLRKTFKRLVADGRIGVTRVIRLRIDGVAQPVAAYRWIK